MRRNIYLNIILIFTNKNSNKEVTTIGRPF